MTSSAESLLLLELQGTGDNANTWGTVANTQFELLAQAIAKITSKTITTADVTLTDTQYATNEARAFAVALSGTLTGNRSLIVPTRTKLYMIDNATGGAFSVTVKTSAGTGVTVPQGYVTFVYCDGTNVVYASTSVAKSTANQSVPGTLSVTGAFAAAAAATVGTTLGVTGATTLSSTLAVTGAAAFSAAINSAQGSDVASASTTNLDTATGNLVDVTGTTTINAITLSQGRIRVVRFTGILTLTHGASLVLPGAASITTAAGDYAIFFGYASSVVRALYFRASGVPVVQSGLLQRAYQEYTTATTLSTVIPFDDTIPQQSTEGTLIMSQAITPVSASSRIRIRFQGFGQTDIVSGWAVALFVDSTANAVAAAATYCLSANTAAALTLEYEVASGSTSSRTYKIHVGGAAGTVLRMNSGSGARLFGGVARSTLVIEEVL